MGEALLVRGYSLCYPPLMHSMRVILNGSACPALNCPYSS
jgi:hypothetical protein